MAGPNYPAVLIPANWEKQKGVLAKPTGIGDGLKTLKKLYDGVGLDLLDGAKLKTAAEVEQRIAALEAEAKKVKSLVDQGKTVAAVAKKWEAEFKKAAQFPKEASAAAASVAKAAADVGDDVLAAVRAAQAELAGRLSKLAADEKKGGGDAESPNHKLVKARVLAGLKAVRAAAPGAQPTLFIACIGKLGCTVYLGPSVGASQKTLLTSLMEGDSGFKFCQGECIWEQKAYTFVGDDIPSGAAKKLQQGLLDLTALRCKVRVRKKSGEVEEVEGDESEAEDAPSGTSSAAPQTTAAPDAGKAFNARLAALMPKIKEAIAAGGPAGQELKLKASEAGALAAQKNFAKAAALLDAVDALLASKGAGAGRGAGGSGAKTLPIWTAAKDLAGEQIGKLQSALRDTRHPLFLRIADQGLNALTKRLQVGLQVALMELDGAAADTRPKAAAKVQAALADFRKFLQTDPALPLLEKNPLGIAITLRAGLSTALDSIEKTLA